MDPQSVSPEQASPVFLSPGKSAQWFQLRSWLPLLYKVMNEADKKRVLKNKDDPKKAMVIKSVSKSGKPTVYLGWITKRALPGKKNCSPNVYSRSQIIKYTNYNSTTFVVTHVCEIGC